MITQKYNLNMIPDTVPVSVGVSQYDKTSRTIIFSIYNGDVLFSIPSGSTAFVRGTKPDKTGFEYACSISGSDISFDIQEQMTVLAGRFPVELRIINSGEILGTANFMLNVEASPLSDDTIISDTDMPLIQEASAAADRAEAAASQASSVLSSAVKKVNNVAPDSSGNVELDFGTVKSVNNVSPDTNGNVTLDYGTVKTINNVSPDSSGNVNVAQFKKKTYTVTSGEANSQWRIDYSEPGYTAVAATLRYDYGSSSYCAIQVFSDSVVIGYTSRASHTIWVDVLWISTDFVDLS